MATTPWKKVSTSPKRRLIMNVVGKEKSGKTNLSLTAPAPILLFDFDYGLEGVVEKFATNKLIYTSEYRLNEIAVGHFVTQWEKLKKEITAALKDPSIRTLVIDTGTEMWELLRMARFGKLTQVMPHNYGPVNAEMRTLIREAYSSDKNLIILHKMTEVYRNEKPTGAYTMAGFKDIPYSVQVNVLCWREQEGDRLFHCEVTDCRQNSELAGFDMIGEMITFAQLATLVFPNTSEEDWI